jgi:hypothetical protein
MFHASGLRIAASPRPVASKHYGLRSLVIGRAAARKAGRCMPGEETAV